MPRDAKRPLWKCPKCGHRFVTKNLWHSCVRVAVVHNSYVDAPLQALMREAYRVGTQELTERSPA